MDVRAQRNRFLAFSFAAADLLVETSRDGIISFAMGAAGRLLGAETGQVLKESLTKFVAEDDQPVLAQALARIGSGQRFGPLMLSSPSGAKVSHLVFHGCRLPDESDAIYLTISEARSSAILAHAANRDQATGLLDRDGFAAAASETVRAARERGQDVTLTLITLPDLSEFEARAGENLAQTFLKQVGALLRTLAVNDVSGYLGPGKFGLLKDADTEVDAITEDLLRIARDADPDGRGIAVDGVQVPCDERLSGADAARALLYTVNEFASHEGSGSISSLGAALDSMARDSAERITRIRSAITSGRLQAVAQPIVDLSTRAIQHYELLVRFIGDMSPQDDVVFAEKTGLIHEIDHAMTELAITYLKNPLSGNTTLAVNISGKSITNMAFVQRLMSILQQNRQLARRLIFEITETTAVRDLPLANKVVQGLRRDGFKVCLDDFGAGATSLQYLRQIDVDFIKIDGDYVRTVLNAPREAQILRAIILLAHELQTEVVAEQIETPLQARGLKALGCRFGQGYLFGKAGPLPVFDDVPLEISVTHKDRQA